ncbi:MAG: thioredoxin domain-containing protein [Candidatus Eiseniibacteriota bacterium]
MTARRITTVWGIALTAALLAGCAAAKKQPPAVTWTHAMDAALADAGKANRPVLVDFYTDWCEWCKALDDTTYVDPAFIEYSKKFTCARVNAEVDTISAKKYRVSGYPTVILMKPDGTEIDRVVGYARAPEFMAQLEDYLAGRNTLASLIAEEPAKGSDPMFLVQLGDRYQEHGLWTEATARYLKVIAMDPKNKSGRIDDLLMTLARGSRGQKDYAAGRAYAQTILDKFPDSDRASSALLEIAINYKKAGEPAKARPLFLDFAKRYPNDEDAGYAREQADTMAVRIAQKTGA